jgi:hypothetical protein
MPRKRKRRGYGTRADARKKRDSQIVQFWVDRINAGRREKSREEYEKRAKEVVSYFQATHDELYGDESLATSFVSFEGAAAVSVPKAAQVLNSLGPHLYQNNPTRNVNVRTSDGVMVGLARVIESYINYTAGENKLERHLRKAVADALLRGRGFMHAYFDENKAILTSRYVRSLDVVIDPDVDDLMDAEWVAIRVVEPIWRVERRTKRWVEHHREAAEGVPREERDPNRNARAMWRIKGLNENASLTGKEKGRRLDDEIPSNEQATGSVTNSLLEYWVVYSKMGSGWRGLDLKGQNETAERMDKEDFVRLEIAPEHDIPLYEGDWEFPFYLDGEWPLSHLDFTESVDRLWPTSLMAQALSLQKDIDLLTSLMLNAAKMHGRVMVAGDKSLEADVQQQLRSGNMAEYLAVDLKQGERLADKFHVLNFGVVSPEIAQERAYLTQEFEATTGVTPVIHGAQVSGAQERSATASNLKSQAATARIADLRDRHEPFGSNLARLEAIGIRLELTAEDVSPFVLTEDIALYYVRVEPHGGATIPVRDPRSDEQQEEDLENGVAPPLTLQYISPGAATYFNTPEEAAQAAMALWEELEFAEDPRVLELIPQLGEPQADPMTGEPGLPDRIGVGAVTVEDVWRDTQAVTPREIMREFSYEIRTGSVQKYTPEAESAIASEAMQNVLPVALNNGQTDVVNAIFKRIDDANGVPDDKRFPEIQPPPPPPMEGEGAPA